MTEEIVIPLEEVRITVICRSCGAETTDGKLERMACGGCGKSLSLPDKGHVLDLYYAAIKQMAAAGPGFRFSFRARK